MSNRHWQYRLYDTIREPSVRPTAVTVALVLAYLTGLGNLILVLASGVDFNDSVQQVAQRCTTIDSGPNAGNELARWCHEDLNRMRALRSFGLAEILCSAALIVGAGLAGLRRGRVVLVLAAVAMGLTRMAAAYVSPMVTPYILVGAMGLTVALVHSREAAAWFR